MPLSNQQLTDCADALVRTAVLGEQRNTRRAYAAALRFWAAWHALRFETPIALPVTGEVVLQFLRDFLPRNPDLPSPTESPLRGPVDTSQHALPASIDQRLVATGYKRTTGALPLTTVRARLSALGFVHRQHGYAEPIHDPQVAGPWRRFQKVNNSVPRRQRRGVLALSRTELERLVDTCDTDAAGLRDRALLLTAWSTALHCGQLAEACIEHVREVEGAAVLTIAPPRPRRNGRTRWPEAGQASSLLTHKPGISEPLEYSGADERPGNFASHASSNADERPRVLRAFAPSLLTHKPLSAEARDALKSWLSYLQAQGIPHGNLFWQLRDDRPDKPATPKNIRDLLTRRATLAGVDLQRVSPASLRKGALAALVQKGAALQQVIQLAGLHRPTGFLLANVQG